MSPPRAGTVVIGQVVIVAEADGLVTAEAIGIADGRVVSGGTREAVLEAARPDATRIEVGDRAVVPGLRDFHLHLVGMARARREVLLDDAADLGELASLLRAGAERLPADAWLRGRGWREEAMAGVDRETLDRAVGGRPTLLYSHDAHSAWASPAALRRAGLDRSSTDPAGGRLERDSAGELSGVLRETATDLVESVAERLRGEELARAVDETVADLAALGVTAVVDAGDSAPDGGDGPFAVLGDRASALLSLRDRLEGQAAADREPARRRDRRRRRAGTAERHAGRWERDGAHRLGQGIRGRRARLAHGRAVRALHLRTAGPDGHPTPVAGGARRAHRRRAAARVSGWPSTPLAIVALPTCWMPSNERTPRGPGAPPDRIEHLQLMRPADLPRLAARRPHGQHAAGPLRGRPADGGGLLGRSPGRRIPRGRSTRGGGAGWHSAPTRQSSRTTRGPASSPPCIVASRRDGTAGLAGATGDWSGGRPVRLHVVIRRGCRADAMRDTCVRVLAPIWRC